MIDAVKIMRDAELKAESNKITLGEYEAMIRPLRQVMTKADYENRLKADMVAMLTDLKNKLIDKSWNIDMYDDDLDFECCYLNDIDEVIQQKIKGLRGEEHE